MSASEPKTPPRAPGAKKKRKGKKKGAQAGPALPRWVLPAGVGVALAGFTAWAWPARSVPEEHVARGNSLYNARRYGEALGEYEAAPGAGPRNAGVHLDRGLARFRVVMPSGDGGGLPLMHQDASAPDGLAQAQDEMRVAARGGTTGAAEDVDAFLRARAAYDLANTFFASRAWDNAIDAYKEALRLRPGWRDAAWNLELARRLRDEERNPPDAGPDAQDAAQDAPPPDAQDSGPNDGGRNDGGGDGGSNDGGSDGGRSDGGSDGGGESDRPDGGQSQPDGGSGRDAGQPPDQPDAGGPRPDAGAPRSMAPLDALDRSSRSLQNEIMRRRGIQPRGPDDDR